MGSGHSSRTSTASQGLILHPVLFHGFIHDLGDGVGCSLSKCAGGKNVERATDTPEGHAAVQRDFDKLEKCADMNLMEFRGRKGKDLNQETNNTKHPHVLEFTQLEISFAEKDLGVLVATRVNTSNVALQGHTNSTLDSLGVYGGDPSPLSVTAQATPEISCPALGILKTASERP